jgi:hypothetical protein
MRFLVPAWVNVEADSPTEAVENARDLANTVEKSGMGWMAIDSDPAKVEPDEFGQKVEQGGEL